MIWWPYFTSLSKRSLSKCRLMDHILCKWRLLRHYFEWVWVILDGLDIILGRWGWVELYGVLFWVGEGEWGHYFGCAGVGRKIFWLGGGGWGLVEVSGGELGWVHGLIMPFVKYLTLYLSRPASCDYSNFLKLSLVY